MVELNSTMLWQIINFLVLLWLLKRYLYGPITEMLDKRSHKIETDLDEARRNKEKAAELKKEYEDELKNARHRAQEIIEDAESRGKKRAREIINEAREEAEQIKKKKLAEIEQAKKEAMSELRNEVASMALLAAGKFVEEKIDSAQHERLINQYIDDLDREKLGEVQ